LLLNHYSKVNLAFDQSKVSFLSFFACPQFVRIDELDVLYVRPKGELHGWSESKEGPIKGTPDEPAPYGVRCGARKSLGRVHISSGQKKWTHLACARRAKSREGVSQTRSVSLRSNRRRCSPKLFLRSSPGSMGTKKPKMKGKKGRFIFQKIKNWGLKINKWG